MTYIYVSIHAHTDFSVERPPHQPCTPPRTPPHQQLSSTSCLFVVCFPSSAQSSFSCRPAASTFASMSRPTTPALAISPSLLTSMLKQSPSFLAWPKTCVSTTSSQVVGLLKAPPKSIVVVCASSCVTHLSPPPRQPRPCAKSADPTAHCSTPNSNAPLMAAPSAQLLTQLCNSSAASKHSVTRPSVQPLAPLRGQQPPKNLVLIPRNRLESLSLLTYPATSKRARAPKPKVALFGLHPTTAPLLQSLSEPPNQKLMVASGKFLPRSLATYLVSGSSSLAS